jgi:small nuclear ribonucleoprotein (snRNP)-like protein
MRPAEKQRTPRAARSLLMFVQALEGMSLIVELSNDTVVRGRIESVDDAMKCATVRCVGRLWR